MSVDILSSFISLLNVGTFFEKKFRKRSLKMLMINSKLILRFSGRVNSGPPSTSFSLESFGGAGKIYKQVKVNYSM